MKTQQNNERTITEDEAAIQAVVQSFMDGWNQGSGELFAQHFAEDADYTVWNGMYMKGKPGIAEGHNHIFSTIYKDTTMKLEILQIRFLREDVAVVHMQGGMVAEGRKWPTVRPLIILSRHAGEWLVDVLQNTPIISQSDGILGS